MKHLLIFAAFTASAASAQPDYVAAAGDAVKSAYGDTWQIQDWKPAEAKPLAADVLFDFDGTELRADGRKVLDDLTQRILAREVESVITTAHSDRLGDPVYNIGLSARRAHAVRDYLVEKGIPESVILIDVAGDAAPVSACSDLGEETRRNAKLVACLQPDRRVEVRPR
jgi:OOP family OmpA-OmpF porin